MEAHSEPVERTPTDVSNHLIYTINRFSNPSARMAGPIAYSTSYKESKNSQFAK